MHRYIVHIQAHMHTFIHNLAGLIFWLSHKYTHQQTHKITNMARWPADGVGLMYFDDMKVDHIYMQIEVPD